MSIESIEQIKQVVTQNAPIQDAASSGRYGVVGRTNPELLESMFGCFADDPAFERVVQFMENEREREREEAEHEAEMEEDVSAIV